MREEIPRAEINIAKIPGGGGVAGAIFGIGSMLIFLMGIPVLWYMFPVAIALGCGIGLVLHFMQHETASTSRIFSGAKK